MALLFTSPSLTNKQKNKHKKKKIIRDIIINIISIIHEVRLLFLTVTSFIKSSLSPIPVGDTCTHDRGPRIAVGIDPQI